MNDKTSGQSIALGQFCFAGLTTAERPTFCKQFGSGGTMNSAINAAAAEKCCIRRVHDGVHGELGHVASDNFDPSTAPRTSLSHLRESRMPPLE